MRAVAHRIGDESITAGELRLLLALAALCAIGLATTIAVAALSDLQPVILGPHIRDIAGF
jgi:hypothetical protein